MESGFENRKPRILRSDGSSWKKPTSVTTVKQSAFLVLPTPRRLRFCSFYVFRLPTHPSAVLSVTPLHPPAAGFVLASHNQAFTFNLQCTGDPGGVVSVHRQPLVGGDPDRNSDLVQG